MQNETYFYPSLLKDIKELTWLNQGDTDFLWIYRENPEQKDLVEDMLIHKFLLNPKVMESSKEKVAILKYQPGLRFHFLHKNLQVRKIVLFGIPPQQFGVQLQMPKNQIVQHDGFYFLSTDAPEELAKQDVKHKILFAKNLQKLNSL
ncbi:MAG: hypothetical protein M9887_02715 [Chitinophagales bacterium]|nr:hypothetical protein [Chitinophagales bacterium]